MFFLTFALLTGCESACGTFTAKTGLSYDGTSIDRDDFYEACGADHGTHGAYDLLGDGVAWLDLMPSHRDEGVEFYAIVLEIGLYIPDAAIVEGAHLDDLTGYAYVSDFDGSHLANAELVSATVDVTDMREPDEPCTPFRAQEVRLAWDVELGSPDAYHYTAVGEDWVSFAMDTSSSDEACR